MSQEQPETDDDEEVTEEEPVDEKQEAEEEQTEEQEEETEPETEAEAEEEPEEEPEPERETGFDDETDLLIPVDDYLSSGVHIGTQQKTGHMERFIHRVREDGLYVIDIAQTDERIRTAASFLSNYEPSSVLVTSSRRYGQHPAETFAEATGARVRSGRFIPGTLTNPDYDGYIEPDVLVVTDPIGDAQAVKEAVTVGIPVIAMCDTNNATNNVDLVVPTNNKGRKALAVVYGLLAEEILDERGVETDYTLEDFEPEV
ncbi:MAG: 30S ribosomal protein S2 [Halobacteriales archaeon]|nr:30S ribosomal protein S2 [Halobacteriales archaeon]